MLQKYLTLGRIKSQQRLKLSETEVKDLQKLKLSEAKVKDLTDILIKTSRIAAECVAQSDKYLPSLDPEKIAACLAKNRLNLAELNKLSRKFNKFLFEQSKESKIEPPVMIMEIFDQLNLRQIFGISNGLDQKKVILDCNKAIARLEMTSLLELNGRYGTPGDQEVAFLMPQLKNALIFERDQVIKNQLIILHNAYQNYLININLNVPYVIDHQNALNELYKLLTSTTFSLETANQLFYQLRPIFNKTIGDATIKFRQASSELLEFNPKTIAIIDVEKSSKSHSYNIITNNLLSSLADQRLTDIYLYTCSAITEESIRILHAKKQYLEAKGFNVLGILNPTDFLKNQGFGSVEECMGLFTGTKLTSYSNSMPGAAYYTIAQGCPTALTKSPLFQMAWEKKIRNLRSKHPKAGPDAYFFNSIIGHLPSNTATCLFVSDSRSRLVGVKALSEQSPGVELMTLKVSRNLDQKTFVRKLYLEAQKLLQKTINNSAPSEEIKQRANNVVQQINFLSKSVSIQELRDLTDVVIKQKDLILYPNQNTYSNYGSLAQKAGSKPSPGWKILGVAMMAFAAVVVGAGLLTAVTTFAATGGVGAAAGLGAAVGGAVLWNIGLSFFSNGHKKEKFFEEMALQTVNTLKLTPT